jgi:hypothetical protein
MIITQIITHLAICLLLFLSKEIPLNTANALSPATQPFNQLSIYNKSLSKGSMIKQFEKSIIF